MLRSIAVTAFAAVALMMTSPASAGSPLDGVYTGQAGQWNLSLQVNGGKGQLKMSCSQGEFTPTVKVGQDGSVDDYITTGSGRRRVTGNINGVLKLEPAGSCGGGAAAMKKS